MERFLFVRFPDALPDSTQSSRERYTQIGRNGIAENMIFSVPFGR